MGRYTDNLTGKRKSQRYGGKFWITKVRPAHLTHTQLSLSEAVYLYAKNMKAGMTPPLVPPSRYWDSVSFLDEEVTTPEWQHLLDLHKAGAAPEVIDACLESMGIVLGFYDSDDMHEFTHITGPIIPIDPDPYLEKARQRRERNG